MNVPIIESRVAVLEAIIEQINHRLTSLNNRMTNIENRINSNFKWIGGLLITVLISNIGTAITIILTLNKPYLLPCSKV